MALILAHDLPCLTIQLSARAGRQPLGPGTYNRCPTAQRTPFAAKRRPDFLVPVILAAGFAAVQSKLLLFYLIIKNDSKLQNNIFMVFASLLRRSMRVLLIDTPGQATKLLLT